MKRNITPKKNGTAHSTEWTDNPEVKPQLHAEMQPSAEACSLPDPSPAVSAPVTRCEKESNAGKPFLLADGSTWNEFEAGWSEGILKQEDVAAAVKTLGESMHDLPVTRIVDCQHRFIQMAGDVNWDCHPDATPQEIEDVLHTWREFYGFLKAMTAGQQLSH